MQRGVGGDAAEDDAGGVTPPTPLRTFVRAQPARQQRASRLPRRSGRRPMRSTARRAYVSKASLMTPIATVPSIALDLVSIPARSKMIGEW